MKVESEFTVESLSLKGTAMNGVRPIVIALERAHTDQYETYVYGEEMGVVLITKDGKCPVKLGARVKITVESIDD